MNLMKVIVQIARALRLNRKYNFASNIIVIPVPLPRTGEWDGFYSRLSESMERQYEEWMKDHEGDK